MGLIYYEKLNEFSRKYLITGTNPNPRNFTLDYNNILGDVSEMLMYYEGISFYVYGENIPLAILINVYGVNGVEALIEQGAINFLFSKPEVMYNVDDIPGIIPLMSSSYPSTKAHNDPEESAKLGLNWLRYPLHEKQKKRLIKKVLDTYRIPTETISKDAVKFGIDGYNRNDFKNLGLPKEKKIEELDLRERSVLCSLANECNTLAILSEFGYDTVDSFSITELHKTKMESLQHANKVREATDKLFKVENLPNFNMLLKDGIMSHKDIPKIRSTYNSIKFREWIRTVNQNSDCADITLEYINAIENTKGLFDKEPGKFLKTIGICATSCLVGELALGPVGAIVGLGTGAVLETALDTGLSLIESYVLGGIAKGWNPRHYFSKDIKKLVENNTRTKEV